MNPLFRIDFSISDSLKIVRKSVLIYETIIGGGSGLCAGAGLTGNSMENQAGCHYAIRIAYGMMKVF